MRTALFVLVGLTVCCLAASAQTRSSEPCKSSKSNAEEGRCYAREQERINAEADRLARDLVSQFRKAASDLRQEGTVDQS